MSQTTSSSNSSLDQATRLLSSLFKNIENDFQPNPRSASVTSEESRVSKSSKSSRSSSLTCIRCEDSPTFRCLDCNILFCHECRLISTCLLRDHTLLAMHHTPPVDSSNGVEMVVFCELHGEPLRFYCKSCAYCICLNCSLWFHQSHVYIPINSFDEGRIGIILEIQNNKTTADYIKTAINRVQAVKKAYEKENYDAKLKIKQEMNCITQVIKKREKHLLEKLYWTGQAKYNEVAKHTTVLREMLAKITDISLNLENCKYSNDVNVFRVREKSRACLESFNNLVPKMDITEEKILVIAPNMSLVEPMRQQCDVVSVTINNSILSDVQPTLVSPTSSGSSFVPSSFETSD